MLDTIYHRAILKAFHSQIYFYSLTEGLDWHFSLATGHLTFGASYCWRTQLLGTESVDSKTWLWAWANTLSHVPDHLLAAGHDLKAFGERHDIAVLTAPDLPLELVDGHTIALTAAGICGAHAYYRCPYDGGALYVLVTDDAFPPCPDPPLRRLATVLPQAVASLDIPDHRLALIGYLDHHGLAYNADGDRVVVHEGGEPALTVAFDGQNRLTSLEATVRPPVAEPLESLDEYMLRLLLRR